MIINASARTDIPAYYSEWFINRIREGFLYVRNPYYPTQVTKYEMNLKVIDALVFCTKNPRPIFPYLDELQDYHPYIFVTITPYDESIEPHVPHYLDVIEDFKYLSQKLGKESVCLRYDPIFLNHDYTIEKHIHYFQEIIKSLHLYTNECIISFIDLYQKTKRNFPHIKEVSQEEQKRLAEAFGKIGKAYGVHIKTCAESQDLSQYGIVQEGCITKDILEGVIKINLIQQKSQPLRQGCRCYPMRDIGEYNTCMHGCLYCYANENKQEVIEKWKRHDVLSPLLIGHIHKEDVIKLAKQESYRERQLSLDI